MPVCKKFYDKCVIRPLVNRCWQILKDEIVGDKDYARQLIEIYKDDNANMMSGRVVQDIANKHLVDDMNDTVRGHNVGHCYSSVTNHH